MSLLEILNPSDDQLFQRGSLSGVMVAIVTNNKDPDGMGRVKLKLPWLSDDYESDWARIATLMAGPERGVYFLPEVDDEVLIAFEHGDIRRPMVLGCLWNGVDAPPITNDDGEKTDFLRRRKRGWAKIISQVWKEDPELCRSCGQPMKIISALTSPHQDAVIERILRSRREWNPPWLRERKARGPPLELKVVSQEDETYSQVVPESEDAFDQSVPGDDFGF